MFGELLKTWRKSQGLSQLQLALQSDVSQRHLSFLESGRSSPSEEMVLQLGDSLGLTLRNQNVLLTSAGYGPRFSENHWQAKELQPVQQALDFLLRQHEPFPAWVLDTRWRVLQTNDSASRLLSLFFEEVPALFCDEGLINVMRLTLHPEGMAPFITNFDEVAAHLIQRLQSESRHNKLLEPLYKEMKSYAPDVKNLPLTQGQMPVMSTCFVKGDLKLDMFSMVTTLGTPNDVTLQELRVESLFPANNTSEQLLRHMAVLG